MLWCGESASETDKEQIRLAASMIYKYLGWEVSKKGFQYWAEVYDELQRIAETGDP